MIARFAVVDLEVEKGCSHLVSTIDTFACHDIRPKSTMSYVISDVCFGSIASPPVVGFSMATSAAPKSDGRPSKCACREGPETDFNRHCRTSISNFSIHFGKQLCQI